MPGRENNLSKQSLGKDVPVPGIRPPSGRDWIMEKAEMGINKRASISEPPVHRNRQAIIQRIALDALAQGCNESEALGLFFWKLAGLDPPVGNKEQLLFCALFRMHQSCLNTRIHSREEAFKLLGISAEELDLTHKKTIGRAKAAYWKQFNELSSDLKMFLSNAPKIGAMKKALSFITDCNII